MSAFVSRLRLQLSSVRVRLTLWNVLVLGLVLIVTGTVLRQSVGSSLQQTMDADLLNGAEHFKQGWPPPPKDPNPRMARRFRPRSDPRDDALRPRIVNAQSTSFFSHQSEAILDLRAVRQSLSTNAPLFSDVKWGAAAEPIRVLTFPLPHPANQEPFALQIAESRQSEVQEMNLLTRGLLAVIPLALLAAGVGAAFLTDRALQPVRAVTRAASGVGAAEDLSARLHVTGNDEFSQLASTFNGMMGRLEGAFRDLERAYQQQRRFVADASHELRTPLTIIKANTSLALSGDDLDPDMRDTLTEIDRGVDRSSRIVQDLFLLARSDSGQLPLERQVVDLAELLDDVCNQIRFLGKDAEIAATPELRLVVPGNNAPVRVCGDRDHLERLFRNLLENARRHTPPDGSITVTATIRGNAVVVDVADTGEGIAPEHLPRLLERFYRVDTGRARSDGGTGLGLAISEAIAHAHGGSISISSVLGKGTTVCVTLPRAT